MMLFSIYVACLCIGGVFVGSFLFWGHSDQETGNGLETHDTDYEISSLDGWWLSFLSLRFWVFFLCFFGLTGVVLSILKELSAAVTLFLSIVMGMLSGISVTTVIRYLRRHEAGKVKNSQDYRNLCAEVILPLPAGKKGKIRLSLPSGSIVDLIAHSDTQEELKKGEKVLILDVQNNQAFVTRLPK